MSEARHPEVEALWRAAREVIRALPQLTDREFCAALCEADVVLVSVGVEPVASLIITCEIAGERLRRDFELRPSTELQ